jgi:hypothetical protein
MVLWFEGGVNQGLLPMTISDDFSGEIRSAHRQHGFAILSNDSKNVQQGSIVVVSPVAMDTYILGLLKWLHCGLVRS